MFSRTQLAAAAIESVAASSVSKTVIVAMTLSPASTTQYPWNPGRSLIIGQGQDGSAFPLYGESMVVGRERGDIMFPEDGYVSGTHARISHREGRYFLARPYARAGMFGVGRGRFRRGRPSGTRQPLPGPKTHGYPR